MPTKMKTGGLGGSPPVSVSEVVTTDDSIITSSKELSDNFAPKRKLAEILAASFYRLELYQRSDRCLNCGTFLDFVHEIDSSGSVGPGKLYKANFCKDRLCPMCSWRRSHKIFGQVSAIVDYLEPSSRFLFLTLTVKNCSGDLLSDTIDRLFRGFNRLSKTKSFRDSVKGWFRCLEVTRNAKDGSYHPHFHIILAVSRSYFTNPRLYIEHDDWLQLWRDAYGDQEITQVHIQKVKPKSIGAAEKSIKSAVAEVAKYAVKAADYLFSDDDSLTDSIVSVLAAALSGRRLCAFGGSMRKAHKLLNLDDAEDGDLVGTQEITGAVAVLVCSYGWSSGCYSLISQRVELPE